MKGSSIDPFGARSLEEGLDADVRVLAVEHLREGPALSDDTLIQWETCCLSDRGLGDVDGMG